MHFWREIQAKKGKIVTAPFSKGRLDVHLSVYLAFYLFVSVSLLVAAFLLQHVGGYPPCVLCVYERWPYVIAGLAALAGLMTPSASLRFYSFLVIPLSYLTNVGLSAYHIAIEHKLLPPPKGCSALYDIGHMSFDQIKEKILSTKFVPCDRVPLKILGLSLVEYNFMIALICLIVAIAITRKSFRKNFK